MLCIPPAKIPSDFSMMAPKIVELSAAGDFPHAFSGGFRCLAKWLKGEGDFSSVVGFCILFGCFFAAQLICLSLLYILGTAFIYMYIVNIFYDSLVAVFLTLLMLC